MCDKYYVNFTGMKQVPLSIRGELLTIQTIPTYQVHPSPPDCLGWMQPGRLPPLWTPVSLQRPECGWNELEVPLGRLPECVLLQNSHISPKDWTDQFPHRIAPRQQISHWGRQTPTYFWGNGDYWKRMQLSFPPSEEANCKRLYDSLQKHLFLAHCLPLLGLI